MRAIHETEFTNSYVQELPGEASGDKRPRQVPGVSYSRVEPTPVRAPRLLAWSQEMGDYLDLAWPAEQGPEVEVLAGNRLAPGMQPFAARYGGHQFGSWAGQLGDGRAISLGEVEAVDGTRWEIQLKGAGVTPYSRRGDGRAVLRSSLREFLCSEAMHWLGVPTTRALSLVATGDTVIRDMFYLGDPQPEKGAIVARVAPTFIRFGHFEIHAAHGETEQLKTLADYVIRRHYPELGEPSEAVYLAWFEEVSRRTAVMIAHWMTVGFVHGVMNTDNMSILGATIDYGPYGWLEPYEPGWTPNTTDFGTRRYAFGQQPGVALWNLMKLGQAISSLVADPEALNPGLETYRATLGETYLALMLRKLGLQSLSGEPGFLEAWETAMVAAGVDMTVFFRHLSHAVPALITGGSAQEEAVDGVIDAAAYRDQDADYSRLREWLGGYADLLRAQGLAAEQVRRGMLRANPKFVPRNYLAQLAIEAADAGDLQPLRRLMHVLRTPFDEHPEDEELAAKRPAWARTKPGSATLSCSS